METTKQKVISISELVPRISYFDFEGFDEEEHEAYDQARFSTRQNGNMATDEPGEADIKEAYSVGKRIQETYPDVEFEVDYYDEWTFLTFTFKS